MQRFCGSVAAKCRYGDNAVSVFGLDSELIWEHSEDDYQGFANILVRCTDGRFAHYEWTYSSCSVCDEWEAEGHDDEKIEAIMRESAAWFSTPEEVSRYLNLDDPDARYPCANSSTNGNIPGMLRTLGQGVSDDFKAMGEAFSEWLKANA
jgi:hypothetical protein